MVSHNTYYNVFYTYLIHNKPSIIFLKLRTNPELSPLNNSCQAPISIPETHQITVDNNVMPFVLVVKILAAHGKTSTDISTSHTGVRSGSASEDDSVHSARLLAKPSQPVRLACHRCWLYMDIHAFHTKGNTYLHPHSIKCGLTQRYMHTALTCRSLL